MTAILHYLSCTSTCISVILHVVIFGCKCRKNTTRMGYILCINNKVNVPFFRYVHFIKHRYIQRSHIDFIKEQKKLYLRNEMKYAFIGFVLVSRCYLKSLVFFLLYPSHYNLFSFRSLKFICRTNTANQGYYLKFKQVHMKANVQGQIFTCLPGLSSGKRVFPFEDLLALECR